LASHRCARTPLASYPVWQSTPEPVVLRDSMTRQGALRVQAWRSRRQANVLTGRSYAADRFNFRVPCGTRLHGSSSRTTVGYGKVDYSNDDGRTLVADFGINGCGSEHSPPEGRNGKVYGWDLLDERERDRQLLEPWRRRQVVRQSAMHGWDTLDGCVEARRVLGSPRRRRVAEEKQEHDLEGGARSHCLAAKARVPGRVRVHRS
jgi:hypothetical protein